MTSNPLVRFSVLTLFPEMFAAFAAEGVIARALENNIISLDTVFLRNFANNTRRNVDEHPIGGGDGMVIRPDVAANAINSVATSESFIINLSPSGKVFDAKIARALAQKKHLVLLCGRYAGFDYRTISSYAHLELSIGDFVLSGGEIAAQCVIDATARFVPGVLGNCESATLDSFENGLLEAPAYTKPLQFNGIDVPQILLSGDHKRIADFRRKEQLRISAKNRPDLILHCWDSLSRTEKAFVEKIWKHSVGNDI